MFKFRHHSEKYGFILLNVQSYISLVLICAVSQDWVYWTDWETESIHSVRKFKNTTHPNPVRNSVIGLQSPMDVRVYHELKQPKGKCT